MGPVSNTRSTTLTDGPISIGIHFLEPSPPLLDNTEEIKLGIIYMGHMVKGNETHSFQLSGHDHFLNRPLWFTWFNTWQKRLHFLSYLSVSLSRFTPMFSVFYIFSSCASGQGNRIGLFCLVFSTPHGLISEVTCEPWFNQRQVGSLQCQVASFFNPANVITSDICKKAAVLHPWVCTEYSPDIITVYM